jgi:hypothetical protein
MTDLLHDLRYGARRLAKERAFTVAALCALALGIGGTAAIFSVVSGVIFRPLPFDQPERLVQMYGTSRLFPRGDAVNNLEEFRTQSTSFDALVG